MKIEIFYSEVSNFIKKNHNIDLNISYKSPTKIHITGSKTLINIDTDLEIVARRKSSIDVKHEITSLLGLTVLSFLKSIKGIDDLGERTLAFRFGQMDGLGEVFRIMELVDLSFFETGIKIEIKERIKK